jgi:hypothetical protein
MKLHLHVQPWWISEHQLIVAGSYFFAIVLWPIFAAIELTRRIAAILDGWK